MTPLEDSLFTLGMISLTALQARESCTELTELDEDSARIRGYLQTLEVLADGSWPGLSPEAIPRFRWLVNEARPLVPEID